MATAFVAAAVLPFHAVGQRELAIRGVHLASTAVIGAAVLLLLLCRQRRVLVRGPLVWAWTLHSLTELAATLVESTRVTPRSLARALASGVSVAGFTAGCLDDGVRSSLLLGAAVGGLGAVGVSLVGYLVFLRGPLGVQPFRFASRHPVLGTIPRLSGTFGHSPQHFGEYLLALGAMGAVAARAGRKRLGLIVLALAALALALTASWAAAAGVAAVAAYLAARPRATPLARAGALATALVVAGAGSWLVNVGLSAPNARAGRTSVPCSDARFDHLLVGIEGTWTSPTACAQLGVARPYPHFMTLYAAAKHASLEAFRSSPLVGVGADGFARRAGVWSTSAVGSPRAVHYGAPHSTYLGALATRGLLGGLSVLALLVAFVLIVARSRRDEAALAAAAGMLALLVVGLDIDILAQRHLWVLSALLGALDLRAGPEVSEGLA